jgi:hypothetical protein
MARLKYNYYNYNIAKYSIKKIILVKWLVVGYQLNRKCCLDRNTSNNRMGIKVQFNLGD